MGPSQEVRAASSGSEENDIKRTFLIPPDIIAEALSSLRGLDLRWSGPITPTEMQFVEQYVQARYPEYSEGPAVRESVPLPSLKEDQEYSDDGGRSKTLQAEDSKKTHNKDVYNCFGQSQTSLKKVQLEPSRLSDILATKSTLSDSSISVPEIHSRNRVLKHCGITEEDYMVLFTTGTREAMMLIGESYPFHRYNFYMTVLKEDTDPIREFASFKEAKVISAPENWLDLRIAGSQLSQHFRKKGKHTPKGVFAYPATIGCTRSSLHWASEGQRNCWHVLLDASNLLLCEDKLNLLQHKPDYVICTLAKFMGHPNKITCLLIRRSSFGPSQT